MLWKCDTCGCLYAVGLAACPQCGGTAYVLVDSGGQPVQADRQRDETPAGLPPDPGPVKPKAGKSDA